MSTSRTIKVRKILLAFMLLIVMSMLLIFPTKYASVALHGARVWATILLPTLFPFMFFSKLFISFDIQSSKNMNIISKYLYNCNGQSLYVFMLSILCGYPIGAKMTSDLYHDGTISHGQAIRTVSFTSNSGPMFIIGSVGCGMLFSKVAGIIILCSHILGALINGLLYRNHEVKGQQIFHINKYEKQDINISDIVFSSINSILLVGAYVIIFFIISEIAIDLKIFTPISFVLEKFGIPVKLTNGFLSGLLEITKGCSMIADTNISHQSILPLICFVISFGGFSTFMQSYTFLEGIISKKLFLKQKITQAVISSVLCFIICSLFY